MNKVELISKIRAERERLDAVLAQIKPEEMSLPGVSGEWSVKDTLAHVAVWYSRAVTLLFQAERNVKLQLPQLDAPDWSDLNAKDYESQKDRPLDRILADFHDSHKQLVKRLENWQDESALFDKTRYSALKGYSLADYVWGDSGEHDEEHRAQIEAWMNKRNPTT